MASHQTFSSQFWHLTNQTKFDQTNLLYIINGEVNKFTIGKQMSGQFSTLIISTVMDCQLCKNNTCKHGIVVLISFVTVVSWVSYVVMF